MAKPKKPETAAQHEQRDLPRLRWVAGAVLIAVVTCVAYFPAIRGEFIFDDYMNLTSNRLVQAPDGPYKFWFTTEPVDYWPVFNTALWLEWHLWGANPTDYHLVNLVLHVLATLLLWNILSRLRIPGAFLAALFFAVHPVNVESVAWITQLKNVLAMVLVLLSVLFYLESETHCGLRRQPKDETRKLKIVPRIDRWYTLSLAAFVLASLSKGSVVVLPLLLLGLVGWLRPLRKRDFVQLAPFALVGIVLAVVNVGFQSRAVQELPRIGFLERLLTAGAVVWFYLYKAVLPVNLTFFYPRWQVNTEEVLWWLPLLAAVAVTLVLWRERRGWSRPLLFAWGYFCVSLAPVLGLTDLAFMEHSFVADHYQHLALIGVVTLAAAGWATWQKQTRGPARWVANGIVVTVAAILTFLTWQQSRLYVDGTTLYEDTLQKNPGSWLAHNNLGVTLSHAGRPREAIGEYEQALQLKPDFFEAHYNLGFALTKTGQAQAAIAQFQFALDKNPLYPEAHYNMGLALIAVERPEEAIGHLRRALRLRPDYAEAHNDLGVALVKTARLSEAIEHFREALRLRPDLADAQYNLEVARVMEQADAAPAEETEPADDPRAP